MKGRSSWKSKLGEFRGRSSDLRLSRYAKTKSAHGVYQSDRLEFSVLPVRLSRMKPPPILARFYMSPPANRPETAAERYPVLSRQADRDKPHSVGP